MRSLKSGIFCALLISYIFVPPASAQTPTISKSAAAQSAAAKDMGADSVGKEYSPEEVRAITWDLFSKGCIINTAQLEQWTSQHKYLEKEPLHASPSFREMGKRYGYPLPDETVNIWTVYNTALVMMQQGNKGCIVASDQPVGSAEMRGLFEDLGKKAQDANGLEYRIVEKPDTKNNGHMMLLAIDPQSKGEKTYMMARLYPDSPDGQKTILIYMRTMKKMVQ